MEFETFDSLSSLTSGKYDWRIKVRVARRWNSIQKITEELRGYNMIWIDDCNVRVHAFVGSRFVSQFEDSLVEGEVYVISNFTVKAYKDEEKNRCFRDKHHIFLSNYTQVRKSVDVDNMIPHQVFCFYDFDELRSLAEQSEFLIDVVGVVESIEDVRSFENKNSQTQSYIKFTISDGNCDVRVTFWDAFGHVFDEAIKQNLEQPVIIIISSCKLNTWEGNISLSNYPATRFFLNYNHHSVATLRRQMQHSSFNKRKQVGDHSVQLPVHTFKDIMEMNPDFVEKKVICQVTIKRVTPSKDWYIEICIACVVELEEVDGKLKCPKCGHCYRFPDKRFRIAVAASDGNNIVQIVLSDREVRRLIGKNVFEVELEHCMEGDQTFPKVFKKLEDVECNITLLLTQAEIVNRVSTYNAVDVVVKDQEKKMSPKAEADSSGYIQNQESFTEGSPSTYRIEQYTPETVKSTNRKRLIGKTKSVKQVNDEMPLSEWKKE